MGEIDSTFYDKLQDHLRRQIVPTSRSLYIPTSRTYCHVLSLFQGPWVILETLWSISNHEDLIRFVNKNNQEPLGGRWCSPHKDLISLWDPTGLYEWRSHFEYIAMISAEANACAPSLTQAGGRILVSMTPMQQPEYMGSRSTVG